MTKQTLKRPHQRTRGNRYGLPTYFADDDIDLEVLDKHSRRGVPMDTWHCTFACAGNDAFEAEFEVGRTFTWAKTEKFVVKFKTTGIMQRQLTANDQGGKVFPGVYRLGAIPSSGRGVRRQGKVSGGGGGRPRTARLGPNEVRPRLSP